MPLRTKVQLPVGSAQWIQDENKQISQFSVQEVEDFTFSARNEIEWLNEHMAEIFSRNQVNVTEIFKTPGKLRGKTPRTNRKRNPLETRQPLTDVFLNNPSLNVNTSPAHALLKPIATFQVAEDVPSTLLGKTSKPNADSGYHGMSEDDMDVDQLATVASTVALAIEGQEDVLPEKSPLRISQDPKSLREGQQTTEGSFHSANEDMTGIETSKEVPEPTSDANMNPDPEPLVSMQFIPGSFPPVISTVAEPVSEDVMELGGMDDESALEDNNSVDALRSPSEGSSPVKSLIRKSSLTFAALPAREPLTAKQSIGSRVSGTAHYDQSRATMSRGSFLGRYTGGKSLGDLRQPDYANNGPNGIVDVEQAKLPNASREESDTETKMTKLHNKSSTQRLHEKINMLGKSQPARPTKSIPAAVSISHPIYPDLPQSDAQLSTFEEASAKATNGKEPDNDDDDDDWIQPPHAQMKDSWQPPLLNGVSAGVKEDIKGKGKMKDQQLGAGNHDRDVVGALSPLPQPVVLGCHGGMQGQPGTNSAALNASPSKTKTKKIGQSKAIEKSDAPAIPTPKTKMGAEASSTPVGTPSSKRYVDGPLSASKSRIQSIMKTARGLFTSSAGVSAQAKMETLSPHSTRTRGQARELPSGDLLRAHLEEKPSNTPVKATEGRKTRSSTEKEEKRKEQAAKERERVDSALEQAREKERKAAAQRQEPIYPVLSNVNSNAQVDDAAPVNGAQPNRATRQSPGQSQKERETKKISQAPENQANNVENNSTNHAMAPPPYHPQAPPSQLQRPKDLRRPVKPAKETAPKPKPQPVAIRVGTLSQRIPLTNVALSSTLQESLAPPKPKQPGLTKKASNASLQTSTSNNSLKSSMNSSAPKPKALLAAERKKEQDEKEAQRKLDQKRENERRRAAQQEEMRRQEQVQRQEAERQREKERAAASDDPKKLAQRQAIEKRRLEVEKKEQQRQAAQQEKSQPYSTMNRPELGGVRHPSKLHTAQDYSRPPNQPPCNPARPPIKRVFEPDPDDEPVRPVRAAAGQSYQQTDKKRRRTEDEDVQELMVRPPIRRSTLRKDAPKQSIFTSNHAGAQQASNNYHYSSSFLKSSTLNQALQHPSQAPRPGPFAEMAKYANGKIPFAEAPNPSPKSPLRPKQPVLAPAKSSPQYINGENIELDDIPTDSDEEGSEDEKAKVSMLAGWVQSPQLRQILEEQERNANPDEIFGPPRSPHMEEMFKERRDRFRNRTSSANWNGSDRLTEEEIRSDRAKRERLRKEGGWFFGL